MQTIEDKLEIKPKQSYQYRIWALYLDNDELYRDKEAKEVEALRETIKKCMNDRQILNKLTELVSNFYGKRSYKNPKNE
jgi:hypothetical protein